jgi:predicted amidohydrolase
MRLSQTRPLHCTALQLPARFGDSKAQLALAASLLTQGPKTDVVLFPEASLTGYVSPSGNFDLSPFAEPLEGPTVGALTALAQRFDCLMVGPLIERAAQGFFNTLVGVDPLGQLLIHYRKRHPWYPETWATPGGDLPPLVHWRGVKLIPAICFDLHFLSDETSAQLDEADVLLFSSAWVSDDANMRLTMLTDLAQRHDLTILNANWGVGEPTLAGQGTSLGLASDGRVLGQLEQSAGRLDFDFFPKGTM